MSDASEMNGGCHCGAVRFHVRLAEGLTSPRRCTCSICRMRGAVAVTAKLGDLTVTSGEDLLAEYRFNTGTARHYFCSRCGIYTHHQRRSNPAELGVNVDFSPVLDLKPGSRSILDHNSLIGERAISADPNVVAAVGSAYAQGLENAGVMPTAKHFPGLGRIRVDTHIFAAGTRVSIPQLQHADWIPFRRVLSQSDAFLMLGHVTVKAIDADNPASHSKRIVQGLIRDAWNYRGIVITDDLDMGAIYHHGFCNAVVESLNAGVDLLLIAYDGQQYYRAMACALDALHQGRIDRAMLEESGRRLDGLRLGKAVVS